MKLLSLALVLLGWSLGTIAQEPMDFSFEEMEDSISSLAIKPLKPSQTRKLLKQVIKRFQQDLKQEYEVGNYRINATFNRDTLAPLFVSRTMSAKAGIALSQLDSHEFKYDGSYKLTRQDSVYIAHYLNTFPLLSPNYVPWLLHLFYTFHGHIDKGPLLPLEKYSTTLLYYNVKAYSIVDAAGRGVYRFVFTRNSEKRFGNDVVYGKKYDVGELTGSAYVDSRTLRLTQFKGDARLPTELHTIRIRYQNDYDEDKGLPVLQQTKLVWEAKGTKIKATIQKVAQ